MPSFQDLRITDADWVDLHAAIGATAGAPLAVQNKGNLSVIFFESPTKPDQANFSGLKINPVDTIKNITVKEFSLMWVRAANISVGEDVAILAAMEL